MNPTVSLILPVRCDEIILRRCVTSLNSQLFTDVEIIVADNSYQGYEEALRKKLHGFDQRVKIIRNDAATPRWIQWRDALLLASGKYVMFLNPGQWLENDAVDNLVRCMEETNADLAEMRTVKCINGVAMKNNNPVPEEVPADKLIAGNELRAYAQFIGNGSYISASAYDKIYRRELLKDVFASDYNIDDSCGDILNIHYLRHARSMVFLSYAGLNYNWESDAGRYRYSALEDAKRSFRLKKLLGMDYQCIHAELENALRTHAAGLILDNGWTREAAQYFIEEELSDPLWRQAGIEVTARQLVDGIDNRDKWLDFTKVLARLLK